MRPAIRIWTLDELILKNKVKLGRGNIISKKDIVQHPGDYPIYSSAREKNGTFGYYGKYMFDEELITWSIDGGGRLFYRPRHKFSVTNVGGTLRVLDTDFLDCRYLHLVLTHLHSKVRFDWVYKAHPSVIRQVYNEIPIPSLEKQREIVKKLDSAFAEIDKLSENSISVLSATNSLLTHLIGSWIKSVSSGKTANLGELAELKGRIGWRGLTAKEYTKSGPLFLSVHSLNHGHFVDFSRAFHISQERYDESPEIQVKEGYILIAKDGAGLGKVGMIGKVDNPTTVNSSLLVVKPKREVRTKYLYCYFLSSEFKGLINDKLGGSTVPHLYQRDIARIPVALLSSDQQDEFIRKFDVGSYLLQELTDNQERKVRLVLELRNSMLSSEFEGA